MVKPKHIQDTKTGKFAGSIGKGKWILPTAADDLPTREVVREEPTPPPTFGEHYLRLKAIEGRVRWGKDTKEDVVYLLGAVHRAEARAEAINEILSAVQVLHGVDNDMNDRDRRSAARARGAVLVRAITEPHVALWLLKPESQNLDWLLNDVWIDDRLVKALTVLTETNE